MGVVNKKEKVENGLWFRKSR